VIVRDDKHVNGSLGVCVAKSDAAFVFVNDIGGKLARANSTKETILFRHNVKAEYRSQEPEARIKENSSNL
jgi:hypothetical protein